MRASGSQADLIEEEKPDGRWIFNFNTQALNDQLNDLLSSSNLSRDLTIIVVPQSSGKSTLFNKLFNLGLPTMSPQNRCQTTEYPNIFSDMEGGSSSERHRGNASYVERMISAFGIKVSSPMIYNLDVKDIRRQTYIYNITRMK
jgi:hypothetical protein